MTLGQPQTWLGVHKGLLSNEVDSWMTGINRNVEGKTLADRGVALRQHAGLSGAVRCGGEGRVSEVRLA